MARTKQLMALDIGSVRVGVALASSDVRIAIPYETLAMNEETFGHDIAELVHRHSIDTIVIGYPRNQSGGSTAQTDYVETMAKTIDASTRIVFQDESLTSVAAAERLTVSKKAHTKADIDAEAAAIILQDYLETHHE